VREDGTGRRVARIVEVEAYIGEEDRASHARFGPTPRNRIMYGPPGYAYVYLVYGMHDCLNVVTETEGRPAAVLIRAVEPIEGERAMRLDRVRRAGRRRRHWDAARAGQAATRIARTDVTHLACGPGLVTAAFGIDTTWNGIDLCDPTSPLRLESRPRDEPAPSRASARVGIAYAGPPWTDRPWRFTIADRAT
jgi:DNA-3-methyladenine glycosylase